MPSAYLEERSGGKVEHRGRREEGNTQLMVSLSRLLVFSTSYIHIEELFFVFFLSRISILTNHSGVSRDDWYRASTSALASSVSSVTAVSDAGARAWATHLSQLQTKKYVSSVI